MYTFLHYLSAHLVSILLSHPAELIQAGQIPLPSRLALEPSCWVQYATCLPGNASPTGLQAPLWWLVSKQTKMYTLSKWLHAGSPVAITCCRTTTQVFFFAPWDYCSSVHGWHHTAGKKSSGSGQPCSNLPDSCHTPSDPELMQLLKETALPKTDQLW